MTWQTYLNQASQLVSQAKYAEAEQIIYQAFSEARQQNDREKIYTCLDLLGYLAFVQKKYQESDQIYRYSAQVKITVLGKDHVEIGKTLKNLIAAAYQNQGYEQVVVYAREALRIYAFNYGTAYQECQQLASNLVELLKWLKRPQEAEQVKNTYLTPAQHSPPQVQQQPVQQQQQPVQQQQQPVQQRQQPVQQQPVQQQQQPVQQQHYQQPVQQQPAQQQHYQQSVQQQPAQQQHYQQPAQQQQHYQQPVQQQPVQQQQQPAQQPDQQQAANRKKRDYSNYAKSVCEVCQMPFEGSECLRCTSGQIAVFDPSSRLGNDFG